jgi:DNA transformation protein
MPANKSTLKEACRMGQLAELPNIGPIVEKQLTDVGITTPETLKAVGAEEAWLRIQCVDASACIHRLLGIEGAIQGVRKTALPDARRAELKAFYQRHKL